MNASVEVLEAKFEAYKHECALDRVSIASDIKALRIGMNDKVSFKHFYWIIGIMITLLAIVSGYIATQLKDISMTTTVVQSDVSFLKGKLSPYDIQYIK